MTSFTTFVIYLLTICHLQILLARTGLFRVEYRLLVVCIVIAVVRRCLARPSAFIKLHLKEFSDGKQVSPDCRLIYVEGTFREIGISNCYYCVNISRHEGEHNE